MNSRQFSRIAFAFVAALGCMANSAMAQQQGNAVTQGGTQQAVPQTRIAQPAIAPMPSSPRMGFMGQMLYGYGMRVLSVNYGSPAGQLGL